MKKCNCKDCFAYDEEFKNRCSCLKEPIEENCPFRKKKDEVDMQLIKKIIAQYNH